MENGIFPNEAVADSALLQILNMSHMPGSNAYAMNELTQLPNIVTYGTLCGLAGDHVENPMLLETGLQTHFSKTNRTLALETQAMNEFSPSQQQGAARHQSGLRYPSDQGSLPLLRLWQGIERASEDDRPRADPPPSTPSEVNKVFDKLNQLPSMSKYFCIHIRYLPSARGRQGDA